MQMLNLDEIMDIKKLKQEGYSIKGIVRETGYSRNTVRSMLREKYKDKKNRKERKSILDPYKDYVEDKFKNTELTIQRIYEDIMQLGYTGSIYQIYRFLKSRKKAISDREKLTVRFETLPGEQAQVDWGYCGSFTDDDGVYKKLYVFVMILGYSRDIHIEFTTSMKREWLLRCHVNAFDHFGGMTKSILYDNMSQIVDPGGKYNREFMDFADHYGFIPKRCRPYRARTKGKVERAIQYVKKNFLPERSFSSLGDANAQGRHWMEYTANCRIHGTTGERPCDRLRNESLIPTTSVAPYRFIARKKRQAGFDGFVTYDRSRYSIPADIAGKEVVIEHDKHSVRIICSDMIVAEHKKADKANMTVSQKEHLAEMWKLTLGESQTPGRSWFFKSEDNVESRSLNIYEEVAQ
jgi:transposase